MRFAREGANVVLVARTGAALEEVDDEIRAAGYNGGYTQLKEHVRGVRPAPPPEPLIRFETAAGHQAQVDFAVLDLREEVAEVQVAVV
mgnify:CR=1 FL=1